LDVIAKHFNEFQNIGDEKDISYVFLTFQCLAELSHDCSAPQVCKALFQGDIYSQYMVTHQLFFQQIAQQRECSSVAPQEYQDRLCSKAYLEAEFLESHKFPTKLIELFAEQVAFCGMLGYPNFMRGDWLQEILSWRSGTTSGCMPNLYGSSRTPDSTIRISVEREGGTFEEECLVGLTSASLGALALNLRYMLDVCEPAVFERYFKVQA